MSHTKALAALSKPKAAERFTRTMSKYGYAVTHIGALDVHLERGDEDILVTFSADEVLAERPDFTRDLLAERSVCVALGLPVGTLPLPVFDEAKWVKEMAAAMKRLKLSQCSLHKATGMTQHMIRRASQGNLGINTLYTLSAFLNLDIKKFYIYK